MQTDLCVLVCLYGGERGRRKHVWPRLSRRFNPFRRRGKVPQHLHCCRGGSVPGSSVTDCRRVKRSWFLPRFSYQRPPSPLTRRSVAHPVIASERAEGMTNHVTSTDSLQSLCSLAGVLHLCPYLCEWRFMVWPVGRRVMRSSQAVEADRARVVVCSAGVHGWWRRLIPQRGLYTGGQRTGLWVKTWVQLKWISARDKWSTQTE